MSFKIYENDLVLSVEGGMSAEMCFAKSLAFHKHLQFDKWINNITTLRKGIIKETIDYIYKEVRKLKKQFDAVLICPGILTIPYLIELMNVLYLPNQILIHVNDINSLKEELDYTYQTFGIKCYAVLGYDGCIPDKIIAWIKFYEIPERYTKLISKLKIKHIYHMGVYNPMNETAGENIVRPYNKKNNTGLCPSDIYFCFVNECYGNKHSDLEFFKNFIKNFDEKYIGKKCNYISDWESGIDNPHKFTDKKDDKLMDVKVTILYAKDSINFYDLSFTVSKCFMNNNSIDKKGYVCNPYFINNPLYEAIYGYISYSYWQGCISPFSRFFSLTNGEKKYGEMWFNVYEGQNVSKLTDVFPDSVIIISNDITEWVLKHRPNYEYDKIVYVDDLQFFYICKKHDIDCYIGK